MTKKIIIFITAIPFLLHAHDISHFFRATPLFQEARLEHKGLTTFTIDCAYGAAKHAHVEHCTKSENLWDIYGLSNMHELGVGVPNKDLTNPLDLLLIQLELEPGRVVYNECNTQQWGAYSIAGKFRVVDASLFAAYNITRNFFIEAYLPIRAFFFKTPCFQDVSPVDTITPNSNTPVWQAFQLSFDAILDRYNLDRDIDSEWGIGDLSCMIGYTYSYQNTTLLDFVDLTFKVGIITPTGKKRNEDKIFSLALGNNGHIGFEGSFDTAFGVYEWLTIGTHINAIGFLDRKACIRIKTGARQTGMIYLAKEESKIHRGTIIDAGVYLKADHVVYGLSGLVGYSFTQQNSSTVSPCNAAFSAGVASDNEQLKRWKMHTIHSKIEYDFSKKQWNYGPSVALFYNKIIGGRRIFKTDMFGTELGLNCTWAF